MRRSENNQMDLNCFFEALEELANRLYNKRDPYQNLRELIQIIQEYIWADKTPQSHLLIWKRIKDR